MTNGDKPTGELILPKKLKALPRNILTTDKVVTTLEGIRDRTLLEIASTHSD